MSTKNALERYLALQMERNLAPMTNRPRADSDVAIDKARHAFEQAAQSPHSDFKIQKILVAVDHKNHAALETALKLATPLHAQVAIVFVLEPLPAPNLEMAYDMTPGLQDNRTAAVAMLAAIDQQLPAQEVAFTVLREGQAAPEIVAAAKDFNADLIIMGTHRRGALARFFMGSVSEAVLRHAHCPVMFVADLPPVASEPQTKTPQTVAT